MSSKRYNARLLLKTDSEQVWIEKNPVLLENELIVVKTSDNRKLFKLGDGVSNYNDLPFLDSSDNKINNLIDGENNGSIRTLNTLVTDVTNSVTFGYKTKTQMGYTYEVIDEDITNKTVTLHCDISNSTDYLLLTEINSDLIYYYDFIAIKTDGTMLADCGSLPSNISINDNNDIICPIDFNYVMDDYDIAVMRIFTDTGLEYGVKTSLECESSFAEGTNTLSQTFSHAEGYNSESKGYISHAEGLDTLALGSITHVEGKETKALGSVSHAEGYKTKTTSRYAHAEGRETEAYYNSHAEGRNTKALGTVAHAEGYNTKALGSYGSHAEGEGTTVSETAIRGAHAEGYHTTVSGIYGAHAEGSYSTAENEASHSEGKSTHAKGIASHSEGLETNANGTASHAEGTVTTAEGNYSHSEGYHTTANGGYSHAEGASTNAIGLGAHAEGGSTIAELDYSHAEGYKSHAKGNHAHAEGTSTKAYGSAAHSEGISTEATGNYSHAEGYMSKATNNDAHAEGHGTTASGKASHSEGNSSKATNDYSHAEGENATASGARAHAEGFDTVASGGISHAEGAATQAKGSYSHSEGHRTVAGGSKSHAEGDYAETTESAVGAHAEGWYTIANVAYQHVQGKYNAAGNYAHIVGGGSSDSDRKNIHTIDWKGNAEFAGSGSFTGKVVVDGKELATQEFVEEKINEINTNNTPSTWEEVQAIVRSGKAREHFNIGDQLTCNHESYGELVWDIIGFDMETSANNPDLTHSMTLQLNKSISKLYFSGCIYVADIISDIPVGNYYYNIRFSQTICFTTENIVNAGTKVFIDTYAQRIVCVDDLTVTHDIKYFKSQLDSVNESVPCNQYINIRTEAFDDTYVNTQKYNTSTIHQFLNSSVNCNDYQVESETSVKGLKYDGILDSHTITDEVVPTWIDHHSGFLCYMDSDFLNVIEYVKKPTYYGDVTARFFLPAVSELYGRGIQDESGENYYLFEDYEPYEYYKDNSIIGTASNKADGVRIKNNQTWWTRSAWITGITDVHVINTDGAITGSYTTDTHNVCPCCVIM